MQSFLRKSYDHFLVGELSQGEQLNVVNMLPHFIDYNVHTSIVCAPEFQNDFWQKKHYFYSSRIISQELITANLFIIKVILNPFSATFHV